VELGPWIGIVTGAVGRGLFAGLIGTVVMTVVQLVEIKLTGRQPSTAPADAAAKVLGVEPRGPAERTRFPNAVAAAHALGKPIAIHSYGAEGGRDAVAAGATSLECATSRRRAAPSGRV
jgi:hypothetical protein